MRSLSEVSPSTEVAVRAILASQPAASSVRPRRRAVALSVQVGAVNRKSLPSFVNNFRVKFEDILDDRISPI